MGRYCEYANEFVPRNGGGGHFDADCLDWFTDML